MRDAKKYFYRNGYVFGSITNFEHDNCSRQVCKFTNWKDAQMWLDAAENAYQKRELVTKTEALKYGYKY